MSSIASNQDSQGNQIVTPQGFGTFSSGSDLTNRLRVSAPNSLFSWKQDLSQGLDLMSKVLGAGCTAAYTSGDSGSFTTLHTPTTAGVSSCITSAAISYDTAFPVIWQGTAVLGAGQNHTTIRAGFYTSMAIDSSDSGAFFALSDGVLQAVIRNGAGDDLFHRASSV